MAQTPKQARCPGCGHDRSLDAQRNLLAAERAWFLARLKATPTGPFAPLEDGMRRLAGDPSQASRWFWACDTCIGARRAVPADVSKQVLGLGTPFAAYVDRPFVCEDCGAASNFAGREQKHWFEKLGFLIWVYPKQCAPCRIARRKRARTNAALADALHGLDPKDPAQLEAVAKLYDELGSDEKARVFRARASKRAKTDAGSG